MFSAACVLLAIGSLASAQSRQGTSYLGVSLQDLTLERAKEVKLDSLRGVEIIRVYDGSPAERAGLNIGDILLTYNTEPILGGMQLRRLVSETPPGRKVKLEFWRDRKTHVTTFVSEVHPTEGMPSIPTAPPDFSPMMDVSPVVLMAWKVPILGLECEPMSAQLADFFGVKHGVLIRSIDSDSGAERAGLRAGDILMSIGTQPVNSPRDLAAFVRSMHSVGRPIILIYVRERKELTAKFVAPQDGR